MIGTKLTKTIGLKVPIIAGGLQGLADANYVAAVGRASVLGFISTVSFRDLQGLRDEIRKCQDCGSVNLR